MAGRPADLGYIGLGFMGQPMALRLLAGGHRLTVWNRTADKCQSALAHGAEAAASPAAVTVEAEIIHLCVTDQDAVERVVFGDDGIAAAGGPGKLLVDHSTISPGATRQFAARLAEVCGMRWVDAPVTGGVRGAEQASLVIFVGGEDTDVQRARPVLALLGQNITHMGRVGAGQATKLCNQVVTGVTLAMLAEMMKLAENIGIDGSQLPRVFAGGFADSRILQVHGPRVAARDKTILGYSRMLLKDLDLVHQAGKDSNTALPMTGAARELWRLFCSLGYAEDDVISLIRLYDRSP